MGNRANFVMVDDDGWQLFYSHLAGCRMLDVLIAGPGLARRYIGKLKRCDWWTDELWADGGAIIDQSTRTLKFFGDELMRGLAERRAVMQVLPLTWPGFTVEWLYDGVNDIAADVGVDPSLVRFRHGDKKFTPPFELHTKPTMPCHLVTVVDVEGDLSAWTFRPCGCAAWYGTGLFEQLPATRPRPVTLRALPYSGVHVDVRRRRVSVWMTTVEPGLLAALPELWPGWQIEVWGDRYEAHLARCKDMVTVSDLDLGAGLDEVENWLSKRIFHKPGPEIGSWLGGDPSMEPPTAAEWATVERAFAEVRVQRLAA